MNIWQIQQELLGIFDELEENGGELTPELEEQLCITQETLKDKVKDYTNVIKYYKSDIENIKAEQKRLKELADSKEKIINRLSKILITAINQFGEVSKSGTAFIDYGTGKVSVRRSNSVEVNDCVKDVVSILKHNIAVLVENNQDSTIEHLDPYYFILSDLSKFVDFNDITISDLKHIKAKVSYDISLADLMSEEGYDTLRRLLREDKFDLSADINKTELKEALSDPDNNINFAKVVTNESLTIK